MHVACVEVLARAEGQSPTRDEPPASAVIAVTRTPVSGAGRSPLGSRRSQSQTASLPFGLSVLWSYIRAAALGQVHGFQFSGGHEISGLARGLSESPDLALLRGLSRNFASSGSSCRMSFCAVPVPVGYGATAVNKADANPLHSRGERERRGRQVSGGGGGSEAGTAGHLCVPVRPSGQILRRGRGPCQGGRAEL